MNSLDKKVKDYLKGKYEILCVRGTGWNIDIARDIPKTERKKIDDILELSVQSEIEMSKVRLVLYV